MWKTILALLLLCTAQIAFCQQLQMAPEPIMPAPPSERAAVNVDDRINHLLQAAEHLESAGLNDEAKKIRQMAEGERTPTVCVQLSVVEVPLTKLDQLGITIIQEIPTGPNGTAKKVQEKAVNRNYISGSPSPITGCSMLRENDQHFSVLKALIKDNVVRVITDPMVVTESGRKASLRLGGDTVPISIKNGITPEELKKLNALLEKFKNLGTKIDLTPVVVDKETVRVTLKASFSELDENHSVKVAGATVPGLKTREISTTCDIKNGYVMVMSGLVEQNRPANASNDEEDFEQTALVCLIKTEIVEPDRKMATRLHSSSLLR